MNGGDVILADEPTGALDSKNSAERIDLLLDLNRQGHTIIIVTHDPKVAARAHRTIKISDGTIIADSGCHPDHDAAGGRERDGELLVGFGHGTHPGNRRTHRLRLPARPFGRAA
ncbi:hypothetical protein [Paracoccus alcaliphilus]|uniref:hypothetical protein n=1 Tax=Paracoccus alcaliphilus TaxID=34002 RepID=UPI000A6BE742